VVLIALASCGLAVEWVGLCRAAPSRPPGLIVPAVVLLGLLVALHWVWAGIAVLAAGVLLLNIVPCVGDSRQSVLALGIPYIGLPAIALNWLRLSGDAGRGNILFLVFVVWASDIGAYVIGRWLDGPKLAPRLSPGKTQSGAIGGLIAAILVGLIMAGLLGGASFGRAAALAGLLGIATQAGDLLESGVKRHFGVKDSGRLIPGHGGLLDRLDGLLAAAAVAALAVAMSAGGTLWQ
jgi:phosphatidate cytidylyltransferase